jgi:hypothetical protein
MSALILMQAMVAPVAVHQDLQEFPQEAESRVAEELNPLGEQV